MYPQEFQSHNGSIKTFSLDNKGKETELFQSHNGSIKTFSISFVIPCIADFNPTMVRLKHSAARVLAYNASNFNPTMVRLKQRFTKREQEVYIEFQSHNGSIKTVEPDVQPDTVKLFQSHNGSIKTNA